MRRPNGLRWERRMELDEGDGTWATEPPKKPRQATLDDEEAGDRQD